MKNIPKINVSQRLKSENMWWCEPFQVPIRFSKHIPRPYLDIFYPRVIEKDIQRALVLMGPRRVGKTVLLHHAIKQLIETGVSPKNICYISVDHPLYNGLDLEAFLEAYQEAVGVDYKNEACFIFFDEIQYLKDWEVYLKRIVDSYRNIKCVVSGSSAAALRLKSIESGAGRFSNFLLPPLTFYEYMILLGKMDLVHVHKSEQGFMQECVTDNMDELNQHFINYLNFGGYPEVALSPEIQKDPGQFVKSDIIDKVLLRDLPSLYGVKDIQELNSLFTTLAYNTAQEVSLEQLSKGSGVAKNTIKRYIEYLEAAFLIKTIHRVDRSARKFRKANFYKVYLTNPSMRAALFNIASDGDEAMGQLVETAVFSQWFHTDALLHYARWSGGEVDIVLLSPQQKAERAIEVKWSDRYVEHVDELKSLIQFCHDQNLGSAMVTSKSVKAIKRYKNVDLYFHPASLYCFMLGYNVIHRRSLLTGLAEIDTK
ncbi:MAG: ATP-binding protein [Candidatus Omnitrophota bacterium]